jgi:hypothetical protein
MYTNEEIKTAEIVKNEILNKDVPNVLKATYMAGEIMMNKEYTEHIKDLSMSSDLTALNKYGTDPIGSIKWNLIKKEAFIEGVEWFIESLNKKLNE